MKATPFPQANKLLKAPPGRTHEARIDEMAAAGLDVYVAEEQALLEAAAEPEVYDLPVWSGEVEGVPRCISRWEPSPEERVAIAAGGPVWLWVVGTTHPPLVLDAQSPFEEPSAPPDNFDDWWLRNGSGILSELRESGADIGDAQTIALAVYLKLIPAAIETRSRTLTEEELEAVRVARIGASHGDDVLLAIIDRLTGAPA